MHESRLTLDPTAEISKDSGSLGSQSPSGSVSSPRGSVPCPSGGSESGSIFCPSGFVSSRVSGSSTTTWPGVTPTGWRWRGSELCLPALLEGGKKSVTVVVVVIVVDAIYLENLRFGRS